MSGSSLFGQSSSAFGSQPAFWQASNASSNPSAPNPFDSTSPFGSQTGGSIFGGTPTDAFGAQSSSLLGLTSVFGASSCPAFGSSMPAFEVSSTPAFGSSSSAFGGSSVSGGFRSSTAQTSPFGGSFQQSQPAFGSNLFGSSIQFGTPSQLAFGASSTPAFGSSSTPAYDARSTPAFGSTASPTGSSVGVLSSLFGSPTPAFGATSTTPFGASSTPAFGASSTPAFGASSAPASGAASTPAFGSSSTPAFDATSTPALGSTVSPTFGTTGSAFPVSSSLRFGSSAPALGTSSTPAFGASSTPAFGASSTPAFSASSTPAFDISSAPAFGAASTPNFSFWSSPAFGSSPFGSTPSAFGAQSAPFGGQATTAFGGQQCGGTRVAAYTPTPEVDSGSGTQPAGRLQSILAMPVYKEKSHEELRWEDFQLGDKGGPAPASQASGAGGFASSGFGSTSTPAFGQSSANPFSSSTSPNPFASETSRFCCSGFGGSSAPSLGSSPFGASTTSNPFGASSTPAFGSSSTPAFSYTASPIFGTTGSGFGVSSSPLFGSSTLAFGTSSTPAFGASSTPSFGTSSAPALDAARTPYFSFWSSPAFGSSQFGSTPSAFGAQNAPLGRQATTAFGGQQCGGTRVAAYTPTPEVDSGSGTQPAGKLESILAIPVYKEKSHEELRWEDYQLGDKGGPAPASQASGACGFASSGFGSTTTPAFGQSSANPFSSSTSPNPFASETPALCRSGFGGSSAPSLGSSPFGASTTSNPFGARSTPAFGSSSTPAFGSTASPTFDTTGSGFDVSSSPLFGSSTPTFGASSTPAFGASSTPAFSASSTPAYGASSSPALGAARTPYFSFWSSPAFLSSPFGSARSAFGAQSAPFGAQLTAPTFGSSGFGQSSFGGQQCGGTRVAAYTPTPEVDGGSGTHPAGKLTSISAMPVYKEKSHDELRWEDYQLRDKGGPASPSQATGAGGFANSGFGSTSTSAFGIESGRQTSNHALLHSAASHGLATSSASDSRTPVRSVLDVMRGIEGLRLHDRHRDMRIDVDNMSYEELLALEERIGNVSSGLSEETIVSCLQRRKYVDMKIEEGQGETEPCCICREGYKDEEDVGKLECEHEFHVECIKEWLMQKNLCPICKMIGLSTG